MKRLIFLAVGMFVVGCSSFIVAGLLPEIGKTIDKPLPVTGQGITVFSLAYLISAPLFAVVSSKRSEKSIVQCALVILILGNYITVISESLLLFLIGRIITGIGAGIFTPSCVAIAMKLSNSSRKGRSLSFILGANSAGVVFGIPVGLHLAKLFDWQHSIFYIITFSFIALIGISFQKFEISVTETKAIFFDRFRLLLDQRILSVIGITCFTSMACIGLHSYVAPLQVGMPNSLTVILFFWGLGGFLGSSLVGAFVDRIKRPEIVMVLLLIGLMLNFSILPLVKNSNYLGLIPFFIWGALGWATTTPQQHTLFELNEENGKVLTALNSSAMGLGGALGTAGGGYLLSSGIKIDQLPFFVSALLLVVLVFQFLLVNNLKWSIVREKTNHYC